MPLGSKVPPARQQLQQSAHKNSRARRYLAGAALSRENSDDELNLEDLPWQWIHEPRPTNSQDGSDDEDSAAVSTQKSRRSNRNVPKHREHKIIGARRGNVEYHIGDCVLLHGDGNNTIWVGVIREFVEDDEEDEKSANFMWFSNQKEIRHTKKKRLDFIENELYITPSFDINPLASINGKATVLSMQAFTGRYSNGKIPRKSKDHGRTFVCRRGCNTRTATYTEEFVWEDVYPGAGGDIEQFIERVVRDTQTTRRKPIEKQAKEDDAFFATGNDLDDAAQETPRKRQKFSMARTPTKQRTPSKLLTPSHKRVSVKKPLEFTPLGTRILSPGHIHASPFQAARSKLHVASVPVSLPCREDEFASVYSHLEAAITDGSGACIYISGTPGTGKTATVREVVAQLNASVMADELDDFIFVEINGMKVTDPHHSYSLLWEALKGERVSPSHAIDLLEREFSHPSPRRVPCVVLMDELDQLVTKNQSVMYNFFNWPGLRHSRLIVLAVANTMDLPERTLSNKISSRLGLTRITFPGYTHEQLMKIIQSRLEGVPGDIVESDAIQFASRKVAAVSGDARRALDICRRAVELAEADSLESGTFPGTPSKTGRGSHLPKNTGRVTIATVKRAINEATTSPLQQYLRGLPLSSKVLLAALVTKSRQTGLAESVLGEVLDKAKQMTRMDTGTKMTEYLLNDDAEPLKAKDLQVATRQTLKVPRVISMGTSAIDLMDAGIIGLEARRTDRTGKIRLNISEEDVKLAFKDDPEIKSLGFSA